MRKTSAVGSLGEDIALLAIAGFGIWYLVNNLLPNAGSGIKDNQAASSTAQSSAANSDLAKAQAAGEVGVLTDSQIASMAAIIDNALQQTGFWTGNPQPDMDTVVKQVMMCSDNVDWLKLQSVFGTKMYNTTGNMSMCSFLAIWCTSLGLAAAIQAGLTAYEAWKGPGTANDFANQLNDQMTCLDVQEVFTTGS